MSQWPDLNDDKEEEDAEEEEFYNEPKIKDRKIKEKRKGQNTAQSAQQPPKTINIGRYLGL